MAAKRHERTLARRQAIQVLYQGEILGVEPSGLIADEKCFIDGAKPSAYALTLIEGTSEHQSEIDEKLKQYSENWALDRMPTVDRAILRLASYEILFVDEVPTSVAINEAVDLAKDFGGEDESPRFVNGVLGRVAESLEGEGETSADAEAETALEAEVAPVREVAPDSAPDSAPEVATEVVSAEAALTPEVAPAAEAELEAVSAVEDASVAETASAAAEEAVE